jgi:hypothetical protein
VTYLEDTGRVVSRRGDTILGLAGARLGTVKSDWTPQRVEQELFRPMQAAMQKLNRIIIRYNQAGQTFAGRLFRSIMLQNEVSVTDAIAKLVEQAEGTGLSREMYPDGWSEVRELFKSCREGARKLLFGRDERQNRGRRATDHVSMDNIGQPQQLTREEKELLATALQGAEEIAAAFINEVNRNQDKLRDPPSYILEWESRLSRIGADLDKFVPESERRGDYEREVLKSCRYTVSRALDHYRSMINALRDGTDIGPLAGMAGGAVDLLNREHEKAGLMWDTFWQESVMVDLEQAIMAILDEYRTDDIDSPGLFMHTAEELGQERQELYARTVRYDTLTETETARGRLKLIANQLPDLTQEYVARVRELIPYIPDPYSLRIMMQKNQLYDPAVRDLKQMETQVFRLYNRLFSVMDVMYHLELIDEAFYEEVVTIVFSDLFRALTKLHAELRGKSNTDGVVELPETEVVRYEIEFLRYYATMCWIRDTSVQIYGRVHLKDFIDKRLNALRSDINQWLSPPKEIKAEPVNTLPANVYTIKGTGMSDVTGLSRALVYDMNDILVSSQQYERLGLLADTFTLSTELDRLLNMHDLGFAWLEHPQASDKSLHGSDSSGNVYLPLYTAHKDFYAQLYNAHQNIEAALAAYQLPPAVANAAREWTYAIFTAGLGTTVDPAFKESLLNGMLSPEQLENTVELYIGMVMQAVGKFQEANRPLASDPGFNIDIDTLSPNQFLQEMGRRVFIGDKLTQFLNNYPPSGQLRLLNEQLQNKGKPQVDSRAVESMWFPVIVSEIREFNHFYNRRLVHLLGARKNYPHQANLLLQRLISGLITVDQADIIRSMIQDQEKLVGARTQALNIPLAFELLERMDLYTLIKSFGEVNSGLKPDTLGDVNEELKSLNAGQLNLPFDVRSPLQVLKKVPVNQQQKMIAVNKTIIDKVVESIGYDALYKIAARSAGLNPDYDPSVDDINRRLAAAGYRHSLRPYTAVSDKGLTIEVAHQATMAEEAPVAASEQDMQNFGNEQVRIDHVEFYGSIIPELREAKVRWFRQDGREVTNNPALTKLLSGSEIAMSEAVNGLSVLLQPGDEFVIEGEGTMRYVGGEDVLSFEVVTDMELVQNVPVQEPTTAVADQDNAPELDAEMETRIIDSSQSLDDSDDAGDFMRNMIGDFDFNFADGDESSSSALIYDGDADHSLSQAERDLVQKTQIRNKRLAGGIGGLALVFALAATAYFIPLQWEAVVPVKISVTVEHNQGTDTVIPNAGVPAAVDKLMSAPVDTMPPINVVEPVVEEKEADVPKSVVSKPVPVAPSVIRDVQGAKILDLPAMRLIRPELFPGMSDSDIIELLQGVSVPENINADELRKKLYGSSALQARLGLKGGIDLEHIAADVQGSSSALVFNDLLPVDFNGFTFSVVSRERISAESLLASLR